MECSASGLSKRELRNNNNNNKKIENVFFQNVRIHLQIKASSLRQSLRPLDYVESEY